MGESHVYYLNKTIIIIIFSLFMFQVHFPGSLHFTSVNISIKHLVLAFSFTESWIIIERQFSSVEPQHNMCSNHLTCYLGKWNFPCRRVSLITARLFLIKVEVCALFTIPRWVWITQLSWICNPAGFSYSYLHVYTLLFHAPCSWPDGTVSG